MVRKTHMTVRSWIVLLVMIVGCQLAGGIGTLFTSPAIPTWYATLEKPLLNPPSWVFGPVWTMLYIFMGIALFVVWRSPSRQSKRWAYVFFGVQLVLNTLWSIVFFGWQNPQLAFFELVALWLAILATIITFYRISHTAAWLLVPYLVWVSFAGYLNFSIWQLNPTSASALNELLETHQNIPLPVGYSLNTYTVAEVLPTACTQDPDCDTPGSYLVRSNCPYTTICKAHRCTVVCPGYGE